MKRLIHLAILLFAAGSAAAHPATHRHPTLIQSAAHLRPGQYVWKAKASSRGALFIVIDLSSQQALLYRNGEVVAASTVSTGIRGRDTPTGMFTILQKEVVHRSRTYDDAPMPYMQRLTWKGVALHAGHVGGHPASHGCIRLPRGFAKRLYAVTRLGTPVMVRA